MRTAVEIQDAQDLRECRGCEEPAGVLGVCASCRLIAPYQRPKARAERNRRRRETRAAEREVRLSRRNGRPPTPNRPVPVDRQQQRYGVRAQPLGLYLKDEIRRRYVTEEIVAKEVGVSERLIGIWASGVRRYVNPSLADQIVVTLDVLWFDVYDPDRYPGIYSPLEWIDVVDEASWWFTGERLIGPEA